MASAGYRAKTPFHRSTSYNIPRSRTPNPVLEKLYAAEPPKRARTPLPHEEDIRHRKRTASTSTWAADQPQIRNYSRTEVHAEAPTKPTIGETKWSSATFDAAEQQRSWDEHAYKIDFQVHLWMVQEETRRIAAAREAERTRLVQEEVRRIQAKISMKRELERLRFLEERRLARVDEDRDWVQRQKAAADRAVANAWAIYEKNWAMISSSSESLSFSTIPWPTLFRPSGPSSITLEAISSFLLSETHSVSQKPKERVKEALRRWHPDRFVRFLRRVPPEEKGTVEEAIGVVARCLNELLSKYSD